MSIAGPGSLHGQETRAAAEDASDTWVLLRGGSKPFFDEVRWVEFEVFGNVQDRMNGSFPGTKGNAVTRGQVTDLVSLDLQRDGQCPPVSSTSRFRSSTDVRLARSMKPVSGE